MVWVGLHLKTSLKRSRRGLHKFLKAAGFGILRVVRIVCGGAVEIECDRRHSDHDTHTDTSFTVFPSIHAATAQHSQNGLAAWCNVGTTGTTEAPVLSAFSRSS